MTQTERVLDYLRRYHSITALDAMRDLGIMRLASRISDLRRGGHSVTRTMIEVENRFGQKTRIARYACMKRCRYSRREHERLKA